MRFPAEFSFTCAFHLNVFHVIAKMFLFIWKLVALSLYFIETEENFITKKPWIVIFASGLGYLNYGLWELIVMTCLEP